MIQFGQIDRAPSTPSSKSKPNSLIPAEDGVADAAAARARGKARSGPGIQRPVGTFGRNPRPTAKLGKASGWGPHTRSPPGIPFCLLAFRDRSGDWQASKHTPPCLAFPRQVCPRTLGPSGVTSRI